MGLKKYQHSIAGFELANFGIRGRCLGPSTIPVHNAKTYLKVTALTVAPSGRFPPHFLTFSDMDGCQILTCIMTDLAVLYRYSTVSFDSTLLIYREYRQTHTHTHTHTHTLFRTVYCEANTHIIQNSLL